MKPPPSSRNISTFERLFTEPTLKDLATNFLAAFLPYKIVGWKIEEFRSYRYFHAVGTFHDELGIGITDTNGVARWLEINFSQMSPGRTKGRMKADERFEGLSKEDRVNYGRRLDELYFFNFATQTEPKLLTHKKYEFEASPYELNFYCYHLPNFDLSENQLVTDRDHWLFWMLHNRVSSAWKGRLSPLLTWKSWNKYWKDWYKRREDWHVERQERVRKDVKYLDDRYLETPAKVVDWQWLYLEYQLGFLPKKKVKPEEVVLEGTSEKLSGYAFPLFRQWTANCKAKYPNLDLHIENEQLILADVEQMIREAIIRVFNDDRFYLQGCSVEGAYSLLREHIRAGLCMQWYTEYVIKQSPEFKTCMALRSLSAWLSLETVTSIHLDEIYESALREKVNLANMDIQIKKEDLISEEGNLIEPNAGNGQVHTVIENLLHTHIDKISTIPVEPFISDIAEIIPDRILHQWLNDNRSRFI